MKRLAPLTAALALAACGKPQGFGGPVPPLATFSVTFTGDVAPLAPPAAVGPPSLRVAIVWGAQWLTEPFCVLPPDTTVTQPPGFGGPAAVIAAGCRDSFGFVPAPTGVAVTSPIDASGAATLTLEQLPATDLLVGGVTARVAYASLVVFDDRDNDQTLKLAFPHRTASGGRRGGDMGGDVPDDSADVVYGASFVTMTAPDRRIAYREGAFLPSFFYPRAGCDDPPPGFSIVSAGGFTAAAGVAATVAGQLPAETSCTPPTASPPDQTVVDIAAQAPADVDEVSCDEASADGSIRYREPPASSPNFTGRVLACAHLPTFDTGSQPSALIQLVVSGRATDRCKGLTHYTLRGCREDVNCTVPDWDFTATPPAWWPCQ